MKPTDPIEGVLIAQLVVANEAALDLYRRDIQNISARRQGRANGSAPDGATRSASRSWAATNHVRKAPATRPRVALQTNKVLTKAASEL